MHWTYRRRKHNYCESSRQQLNWNHDASSVCVPESDCEWPRGRQSLKGGRQGLFALCMFFPRFVKIVLRVLFSQKKTPRQTMDKFAVTGTWLTQRKGWWHSRDPLTRLFPTVMQGENRVFFSFTRNWNYGLLQMLTSADFDEAAVPDFNCSGLVVL